VATEPSRAKGRSPYQSVRTKLALRPAIGEFVETRPLHRQTARGCSIAQGHYTRRASGDAGAMNKSLRAWAAGGDRLDTNVVRYLAQDDVRSGRGHAADRRSLSAESRFISIVTLSEWCGARLQLPARPSALAEVIEGCDGPQ